MISLRYCPIENCDGLLKTMQTGAFHMDTRVTRLKCKKCSHLFCSVQFIAPIEVMKYTRVVNGHGNEATVPRLRYPITVSLDPDQKPTIKIHKDTFNP